MIQTFACNAMPRNRWMFETRVRKRFTYVDVFVFSFHKHTHDDTVI